MPYSFKNEHHHLKLNKMTEEEMEVQSLIKCKFDWIAYIQR